MAPAPSLDVRAERIAAGGDAIARHPDGRILFVEGAIPGELVRVAIVQQRKDFAKAAVVDVVEPSPDRIEPPCGWRTADPACGGCGWQHITVERQRALKRELVADALRRVGGLDADHVEASLTSGSPLPAERFRTTVRTVVDRDGRLGFRAGRSHDVVTVDDCLVAHPAIAELIAGVRVQGATEVTLRVGARTGERLAVWDGPGRPDGFPADVALGEGAALHERVGARTLRVSARSFFQSSPEAADALVAEVMDAARESVGNGPVVDAYGGVGLFAGALPADVPVTVVELSASSIADARVNLADRSAGFVQGAVEDWPPASASLVIADPARRGLGAAATAVLAGTGCHTFVLVSCDAAAGARDVRSLVEQGFRHRRSVVLDPFPHTSHVEVVSLLTR